MFAFRKSAWALDTTAQAALASTPTLADLAGGLLAGTRVATAMGWRDVAALTVGDQVLTFDGGLQTVTEVAHEQIDTSGDFHDTGKWLIHIPAGVLGDHDAMTILPGQPVMIEVDLAETLFGDPFAIVPAHALVGYAGVDRVPPKPTTHIVTLRFDDDQVVFANRGCLLVCPTSSDLFDAGTSAYQTLTDTYSALLVDALKIEATEQGEYQLAA